MMACIQQQPIFNECESKYAEPPELNKEDEWRKRNDQSLLRVSLFKMCGVEC
eukprot:c47752_g1_i1 orf=147-302(+)